MPAASKARIAPRSYRPHVTLARLRDASSRQVADYLASRQPFRPAPFPVSVAA
jgi:RNA 2',3'-cyclic 3'-phosphodiesterase